MRSIDKNYNNEPEMKKAKQKSTQIKDTKKQNVEIGVSGYITMLEKRIEYLGMACWFHQTSVSPFILQSLNSQNNSEIRKAMESLLTLKQTMNSASLVLDLVLIHLEMFSSSLGKDTIKS